MVFNEQNKEENSGNNSIGDSSAALLFLAQHINSAVICTDPCGAITWVNKCFESFTGYTLADISGKTPGSFLQGKNTETKAKEEIRRALRSKSPCKILITNYTKEGVEYQTDLHISPLFGNDGQLTGFIGLQHDLREVQKAEVYNTKLEEQNIELKALKKDYQELLNSTSDMITSLDAQGTILFANNTWLEKMGYCLEEVVSTNIFNYIHPRSQEHCMNIVTSMQLEEKQVAVSYSLINKQEQEIEVESIVKTFFADGALKIINSHLKDRTELNKLKRSEENHRRMLVNYKVAIDVSAIVSITDVHGVIKYANENFCNVSGYKIEELIGRNHSIINSKFHSKEFFEQMWSLISQGHIWQGVIRNRAKNGDFYWVYTSIIPTVNSDGDTEYISIRYDITALKIAEEQVIETKTFYEHILHNIPVDIAVFDENHKYIFLNREAIKNEELRNWLVGKDDFDYAALKNMPTSFAEFRREKFKKVIESGGDIIWEDQQINQNGEVKYKDRRFHTYADRKTVIGYGVDITTLKKTQIELEEHRNKLVDINNNLEKEIEYRLKELRESNMSLESFAYAISHDLKAPLRQAGSFIGLLKLAIAKDDKEDVSNAINYIDQAAKRMDERIDALLQFSRFGTVKLDIKEFDLHDEFQKAFELYSKTYGLINYTFINGIKSNMRGDRSLMGAVVENLVSNAIKYSLPKDCVHIEIGERSEGGDIVFFVRDQGIGFDMKYYGKVFSLFQRLHTEKEVQGMGIGLAHVKRIIERHNGRIWAESVVGQGTTFYFTINVR